MFGMSMTELVIIALFALIVLGPKELPDAARKAGKVLRDLRRTGDDLRDTFEREIMQENPLPKIRPVLESVAQEVSSLPEAVHTAGELPAAPVDAASEAMLAGAPAAVPTDGKV
jgi:sec-independent protein translocase protein TatB